MEIIDFHVHPLYDFQYNQHGVEINDGIFRDDLLACGVTRFCGSCIFTKIDGRPLAEYESIVPELNRITLEKKELYGDCFIPGIHVHSAYVDLSCEEIEKYSKMGVRLIGELVPYMMAWNAYATKEFLEIADCAAACGMTLSLHPTKQEDMHEFCRLAPKNLNIVWAHFSAYGGYDHHMQLMKKHENVYFDISAHGCDTVGAIAKAVKEIGSEKLLFGTDYPGIGPASDIAGVMFEDISDKDRENIFFGNAKRLLGL